MVHILSRGTSSERIVMRKELPPGMLLVDVVLRANLFPLQQRVQRQGAILEALFRISKGYYFGSHHLIMAALLHFEEKVHKRRLTRADTILLLFPQLLCHVLAHMGFPTDPHSETRRHCRESFSLDQWNQVLLHQHSPELPEPREVPPQPLPSISSLSTSAPLEPAPEAASSDAHLLFLLPQSRPLLSWYRDQQTLILHGIQQHLGLLPPAPPIALVPSEPFASADDFAPTDDATPVAVPSTVAAEDLSYPPEEPTT
ncbi:hypothetical protein CK203_087235 [Vitis vinifera]|uniref:Uncharacterized protein n=1 Tax=Vitis vinifera TaxID=29760 RepID=A0A438BS18_VITVI|nr:hypothetical protein CK203_087235 [Vitis vinifera]